jgi:hypothetical protein
LKTRLEKLHCRPVTQDEAATKLGYGLRSLILDKRDLFPFLYLDLFAGILSVTTVLHSVPCGWIKLCVRTVVDVRLLCVCKKRPKQRKGKRSRLSSIKTMQSVPQLRSRLILRHRPAMEFF